MWNDEEANWNDENLGNMAEEFQKLQEKVAFLQKKRRQELLLQLLAYQWVMIQFLMIV